MWIKKKAMIKENDTLFERFCAALSAAGGKAVIRKDSETLSDIAAREFPQARRVASNLPGCGTFNPDSLEDPRELDGTDLAIVEGEFGVAENGAVWLGQKVRHRGLYFISEALMIVIPSGSIVSDMHEAYRRLEADFGDRGYGVFISGPSKTADIEQALVFGAHGAEKVIVVLN